MQFINPIASCPHIRRQCLQIAQNGTPADEIALSLQSSRHWSNVKMLTLHRNMRLFTTDKTQHDERQQWADFIERVGTGQEPTCTFVSTFENEHDIIQLPSLITSAIDSMDDLINFVYPAFNSHVET